MIDKINYDDEFYSGQLFDGLPAPEEKAVGYASPPKEHQFKKGQSGNPFGRPKKAKAFKPSANLLATLAEELAAPMPVMVKGKKKIMTKDQVVVKRLVADLLTDDHRVRYRAMDQLRKMGLTDAVDAIRHREEERQRYDDQEDRDFLARCDEILQESGEQIDQHDYHEALAIVSCSCGAMTSYKHGKPEQIANYEAAHPNEFPTRGDGPEVRAIDPVVRPGGAKTRAEE